MIMIMIMIILFLHYQQLNDDGDDDGDDDVVISATIGKRLSAINVENVEENRRAYRELLFSCGKDLKEHISGVILFHETIYQKASNGQTMVEMLKANGIIPGIKVDTGTVPLLGTDGECTTQGAYHCLPSNHICRAMLCMSAVCAVVR